jgi:dipeptidyl aminopeptidase/acylaminoacyl peptidase
MIKKLLVILLIITVSGAGYWYYTFSKRDFGGVIGETPEILPEPSKDKVSLPNTTISIDYLRSISIDSAKLEIVEELPKGSNYKRYIASYYSEGNKIYGLLTVPDKSPPEGGFSAIVFNHGYIPPQQYSTTEKYVAYVDYLARNGFVVFKIDMRGHGKSEGKPVGSYFSSAYTIDAISALRSLQKLDYVNSQKIGMWGHSMSGNLVLRSMLVTSDVKAGVIWAGAVYSYQDFAKYRLSDRSYVPRQPDPHYDSSDIADAARTEITKLRQEPDKVDFNDQFWTSVSLTKNINYLSAPLQIHHALNDSVVSINYSKDLAEVLKQNNKKYEFFEYKGGEHNIESPYFEQAMSRTVKFFQDNLN